MGVLSDVWMTSLQNRANVAIGELSDDCTTLLQSGEKVAIVGRTGAGKSTIVAALTRMLELEGGRYMACVSARDPFFLLRCLVCWRVFVSSRAILLPFQGLWVSSC